MLLAPTKQESKLLTPFSGLMLNQIFVPGSKEAFISATNEIINSKMVGFDTESKPVVTIQRIYKIVIEIRYLFQKTP